MPTVPLPNATTRRLRQREEARQGILDAAEEILVSGGYASFSMRKLAARCGYTAPTIYHYFGDKPGLLDTLVGQRMGELVEKIRAVRIGSDPVENMRELFEAFVGWGLEHPTHYQLLTAMRDPEAEPHPTGEMVREMLERPIAELEARGRLDAELETARQAFWALLHGLVSLPRMRPDVAWSDDLVDRSLRGLIDGLVRPESKS